MFQAYRSNNNLLVRDDINTQAAFPSGQVRMKALNGSDNEPKSCD